MSAELLSSFLLFSPFLSDDDKDHDDLTKDWRLLSLLAIVIFSRSLSPLLSFCSSVSRAIIFFSSFLSLFSPTTTRTTTTSLRIGVVLVCLPSYCVLFSLSHPSSLLLVVCQPNYRLLPSPALLFLFDDDDDDDHTKDSPALRFFLTAVERQDLHTKDRFPSYDGCVCVHPDSKSRGEDLLSFSFRGRGQWEPNWDQSQRRRPVSACEARMDTSLCTCFFIEWPQAKPRTFVKLLRLRV